MFSTSSVQEAFKLASDLESSIAGVNYEAANHAASLIRQQAQYITQLEEMLEAEGAADGSQKYEETPDSCRARFQAVCGELSLVVLRDSAASSAPSQKMEQQPRAH